LKQTPSNANGLRRQIFLFNSITYQHAQVLQE